MRIARLQYNGSDPYLIKVQKNYVKNTNREMLLHDYVCKIHEDMINKIELIRSNIIYCDGERFNELYQILLKQCELVYKILQKTELACLEKCRPYEIEILGELGIRSASTFGMSVIKREDPQFDVILQMLYEYTKVKSKKHSTESKKMLKQVRSQPTIQVNILRSGGTVVELEEEKIK